MTDSCAFDSCAFASTQDWIRGKIPFFVPPPEPTDAAGKPVPRPLKLAGAASAEQTESAPAKVGATKSTTPRATRCAASRA